MVLIHSPKIEKVNRLEDLKHEQYLGYACVSVLPAHFVGCKPYLFGVNTFREEKGF